MFQLMFHSRKAEADLSVDRDMCDFIGWSGGWPAGRFAGFLPTLFHIKDLSKDNQTIKQSDNQIIRQSDRHSDNQIFRQSDNHTKRQSGNQKNKQTHNQTDNQTYKQIYRQMI